MGAGGLEPPQRCRLRILSPLRLPISPCPQAGDRAHLCPLPILDFSHPVETPVTLPGVFSDLPISLETLLVIGAYAVLGGAYLVVAPLVLYWWMNRRWMVMGKLERTAIYGLVFLFFPGLILFSPFLNFRLVGQGE